MSEALKTSSQMSLWDIHNAISSLELASGHWLCAAPDGRIIGLSGREVAHASLSARQALALRLRTQGTFGQVFPGSSNSARLQSSLESRLQARLSTLGSTLYKLTWKPWVTPSGPSRFRLRASVRRTSATGCTGWPTPRSADGAKNVRTLDGSLREIARKGSPQDLCQAAQMAGWLTPTCPSRTEGGHQAGNNRFVTGTMMLVKSTQPARLTGFGVMLTGSDAQMDCGGPLSPEHSRWLMALPPEWTSCAPTETLSMLKRRKNS